MESLKQNIKWHLLAGLFIATTLIWYAVARDERDLLIVTFLDVGQGDAIFIEAPNGNQMLIDGGPNSMVLQELGTVIPFYDRSIDVVLATHPDKDHIGGLPEVLSRYTVQYFIDSGAKSDSAISNELNQLIENTDIQKIIARRGMVINLDTDVYLHVLFPDRDASGLESNTASIVARLVYKDTSFLLTGDSPRSIERYLSMLDQESIDVDILKIGHHGSKTSTEEILLGYASPMYAIISSGKDNRYGHPHKDVLSLLKKFEIPILRTDERGSISFSSDGREVVLVR